MLIGGWNSLFAYWLFAALLYLIGPLLVPLEDSSGTIARWVGDHYYLVAQWASWFLGVPQSTVAFKYVVFKSRGNLLAEIGRSYLVYAPLQLLSFGILWLSSGLLGLHPLVGQLVAMVVNAVLSYFSHKHFTFRH